MHRVCGGVICNRTDELQESDVGTECGLFEVRKIGDEYFTYLVECKEPKACSIVLRGPSKDILNEVNDHVMGCKTTEFEMVSRWNATCKMLCKWCEMS